MGDKPAVANGGRIRERSGGVPTVLVNQQQFSEGKIEMAQATEEQAEDYLKKSSDKVSPEDADRILGQQEKIEKIVSGGGPLKKLIEKVKLMFSLVRDYTNGSYREIPWSSIAAIVAALAYVLSPVDLIPDFIPVVGYVDDAMVVGLCLKLVGDDLDQYAAWKKRQA